MSDPRRPPGRPRHYADETKRHPLAFRTTAALKRALVEASKVSGRSLAQEIEYRLWHSLAQSKDRTDVPVPVAVTQLGGSLEALRRQLGEFSKVVSLHGAGSSPKDVAVVYLPTAYTTNYDDVLEKVIPGDKEKEIASDKEKSIASEKESEAPASPEPRFYCFVI
jgi:hypothetical protein